MIKKYMILAGLALLCSTTLWAAESEEKKHSTHSKKKKSTNKAHKTSKEKPSTDHHANREKIPGGGHFDMSKIKAIEFDSEGEVIQDKPPVHEQKPRKRSTGKPSHAAREKAMAHAKPHHEEKSE